MYTMSKAKVKDGKPTQASKIEQNGTPIKTKICHRSCAALKQKGSRFLMHTCERDFKMSSSATVMWSVSEGSSDSRGGMGHRPRHQRRRTGVEAYSCLCGSFILVLVTLLVVFVVGIIRSRQVTGQFCTCIDQYQAWEGEGLSVTKTARGLFVNNYVSSLTSTVTDLY